MASDAPSAATPLQPREFLILLALSDGPRHGYGILKAVAAESGGDVRFDPANLYRTLKRLHRDGLVSQSRLRAQERRRTFALTDLGRRILRAEAVRLDRLASSVRARRLLSRS
jgi:DNA-binding PadR family transcriptional regulator